MKKKICKKICLAMTAFSLALTDAAVQAEAKSPVSICNDQEWEVLKLVNRERLARGIDPLSVVSSLQAASDVRSAELCKEFSHTRPDGSDYFTALQGIRCNTTGENIAAGYPTSEEVMKGWMNSLGHKENILSSSFTHLGVGYHSGIGRSRHYWLQMFIGGCIPISISVGKGGEPKSCKREMKLEAMDWVLEVKCDHGTSYVPLVDEMCSGYDRNTTGTKNVKVEYRGRSTSFKVNVWGISIRKAKVSNVKNKVCNGRPQTQAPKVTLYGRKLVKNRDYTISYKNNRKKGRATMIITGKGIYSGTVRKHFKITKKISRK